jgi:hypothetical protein
MILSKHKKHIAIIVLSFFCLGWADSWEELRVAAGGIRSVQAEFVQEKHLPILAKPLISRGVFYYQGPGSLRWEYRLPVKSVLIMHEGRIRRFVDGPAGLSEERGAGIDAMQVVMQEIAQWLAGRFDESTIFEARLEAGGSIELVPREPSFKKVIQRIVLNLGDRPGMIDHVTIYESQDAFTRMTFNPSEINRPIDGTVFQKVP